MFQILLQECTLIKEWAHMFVSFEKIQNVKEQYKKTSKNPVGSRLETTFQPSFLFIFMICYHCVLFVFRSNNKYWKIPENTPNIFLARNHPPAFFLVPIHDLLSLHVILVQAKNIRKYRKIPATYKKTYPKKRAPSKNTLFTRIEHTFQQWGAGSLHECTQ